MEKTCLTDSPGGSHRKKKVAPVSATNHPALRGQSTWRERHGLYGLTHSAATLRTNHVVGAHLMPAVGARSRLGALIDDTLVRV